MKNKIILNLDVVNKNWKKLMYYGFFYEVVCLTLEKAKLFNSELTIRLINNNEIKKLNTIWRQKNLPTNVLAFPNYKINNFSDNLNYIGDVAISYDKIREESNLYGIPFFDHVIHIVIHGVLHLAGYDHNNKNSEKKMMNLEKIILNTMSIDVLLLDKKYKEGN